MKKLGEMSFRGKCRREKRRRENCHLGRNVLRPNNLDIVKLLVENGASINTRDGYGGSPFHNAVSEKHMEILTFFMENGADMRLKTKHFRNNSIELALKGYSINILKKLIHQ